MHITHLSAKYFRRFTDLTITDIPQTAKVVMMAGPNGSGKSSVFDAFRTWVMSYVPAEFDSKYYQKQGITNFVIQRNEMINITFSENVNLAALEDMTAAELFYFRTAYRNEPDFTLTTISLTSPSTTAALVW